MATITINVDDAIYEKFRKFASDLYSGKKGFLGDAVTDAMEKQLVEDEQEAAKNRLRALMKKGVRLGYKGYKSRDELYEERMDKILAGRH